MSLKYVRPQNAQGACLFQVTSSHSIRALRAWSICSSVADFVSSITSEISQTSSRFALSSIRASPIVNERLSHSSVSDATISARSNGDPDVSNFELSLARCFQL